MSAVGEFHRRTSQVEAQKAHAELQSLASKWLRLKTQETPGEHQNRWQMDVHPPQYGAIGYAPWPSGGELEAKWTRLITAQAQSRRGWAMERGGKEGGGFSFGATPEKDCPE